MVAVSSPPSSLPTSSSSNSLMYDIEVVLAGNATFARCVRETPALSEWHPKSRSNERGGTSSTGEKAEGSGAFGGWNDLDRMVKWREGGGETKQETGAICDPVTLRSAIGGGATDTKTTVRSGITVRIQPTHNERSAGFPHTCIDLIQVICDFGFLRNMDNQAMRKTWTNRFSATGRETAGSGRDARRP